MENPSSPSTSFVSINAIAARGCKPDHAHGGFTLTSAWHPIAILAVRAGAPRPRIVDDGALVVFGLLGDLTAQNVLLLVENALVGFRDVAFVEARHIALFLTN